MTRRVRMTLEQLQAMSNYPAAIVAGAKTNLPAVDDLGPLLAAVRAAGFPEPTREHRFAKEAMGREWRFDLCWPEQMTAFEREGRIWVPLPCKKCRHPRRLLMSRHAIGNGYDEDMAKYNAAAVLGWTLVRATAKTLADGTAAASLVAVLESKRRQAT
ncbi:hypothetical protein [Fimbriiglobus ruber]|uniref:Uncharacterized protein n=1 Tax=Fimbriiglobus ruber TaxID=1908690 RepID=A0A225CYN2_9BACT|nr:hypothetical protein [Fimbriiglobus ruber]OWK34352.1 hypothetical protein FRUB_10323 [Fimbriiglobus ruber]